MRIQQANYNQSIGFVEKISVRGVDIKERKHDSMNQSAVNISISEEGQNVLRRNLQESDPKTSIEVNGVVPTQTNEVAWEHYTAMKEMSGMSLKDGNYNVKDVMKSIMETYETRYNQIMKEHENGNREVFCKLTGTKRVTLEEDLAALDDAYKMRLANLDGYITCQQTNKEFENPDSAWYFRNNHTFGKTVKQDNYNYFDIEYRNFVQKMMEQTRRQFLKLVNKDGYNGGIGRGLVSSVIEKDIDFVAKAE